VAIVNEVRRQLKEEWARVEIAGISRDFLLVAWMSVYLDGLVAEYGEAAPALLHMIADSIPEMIISVEPEVKE
jgi:hypothetical protein